MWCLYWARKKGRVGPWNLFTSRWLISSYYFSSHSIAKRISNREINPAASSRCPAETDTLEAGKVQFDHITRQRQQQQLSAAQCQLIPAQCRDVSRHPLSISGGVRDAAVDKTAARRSRLSPIAIATSFNLDCAARTRGRRPKKNWFTRRCVVVSTRRQMDANTNGLQQQPQSSPSTYRSTYDDVQLYMTINPFSKHFGGLNEGGGIESFEGSFERKTREKKRGAMLCASVTVTPQSIDTTLDSLSFFFFFLSLMH